MKDNSSASSIDPVASTHEVPQCLLLLRVIAQRLWNSPSQLLEEGLLDLARILHVAFWASGYHNPRERSVFSTWTVPVSQYHIAQDNM